MKEINQLNSFQNLPDFPLSGMFDLGVILYYVVDIFIGLNNAGSEQVLLKLVAILGTT